MNNIDTKKSYKRASIKDFDEDLFDDNCLPDVNNKTFMNDLNFLPYKFNKMKITTDDSNFGSKSTKSSSKKTHNRLNQLINKEHNDFFNTKSIIIEKKDEKDKDKLSDKTQKVIDDIISKKNPNLINKTKFNLINDNKYSILKSINKNKEKEIILSDKTKNILELLKQKKYKPENESKSNDEVSKTSLLSGLKYKYQELISKPRQLRIPLKYKEIYQLYKSLENFISLTKINKKINYNTFTNLRKYYEEVIKVKFTIYNFKQILYVVPHFFIIKFIKIDTDKETVFNIIDKEYKNFDFIIDIPKNYKELQEKHFPEDFNFLSLFYYTEKSINYEPLTYPLDHQSLEERNNIFLNSLILIVKRYHDQFLIREKILCLFDPLIEKTWYHSFDVENECGDIPIMEFPPPKEEISVYEKEIKDINKHNFIMREVIEKTLKDKDMSIKKPKNKYISQEFYNKIKRKEEVKNITNELSEYQSNRDNKNDICNFYVNMLVQIKTILLVNKQSLTLNTINFNKNFSIYD